MMKKYLFICCLILALLVIPGVFAKQGSLRLLAVQEKGGNLTGSLADLYLDIRPGSGRVFVDTFPLTKLDTQVSTRFAKEIACNYLDTNCDQFDFFYTIRSSSPIIAGPSAGAAITVLTISLLGNIEIFPDVAITGTINSGGIIGPVGALEQKITAASRNGIKKVLIPVGERYARKDIVNLDNLSEIIESGIDENITAKDIISGGNSVDLVELGKDLGIEVKEVSDINDVLFEFTGISHEDDLQNITIDPDYKKIMSGLAMELCKRSDELLEQIAQQAATAGSPDDIIDDIYQPAYEIALNFTRKGDEAFEQERLYSSASYCFGANVKLGYIILAMQNESEEQILERIERIEKELASFKKPGYRTITDLQAYMVVEERIHDSKDLLESAKKELALGNKDKAVYDVAYSIERKFSAYAWSTFINGKGKVFRLSKEDMFNSCQKKLSEAEERYQYVILFFPAHLSNIRKGIDAAYLDFNNENYEACLFKASKAKAEIDVILSVFGVEKENLDDLIQRKLDIVKKTIVKQTNKGIFPIVGFSYYEYATDLKDTDKFSSLLYSDYALEMSNLDIYFPEKHEIKFTDKDKSEIGIFLIGIGVGLLIGVMIMIKAKKKKKKVNQAS